jgi:hypothetical protein
MMCAVALFPDRGRLLPFVSNQHGYLASFLAASRRRKSPAIFYVRCLDIAPKGFNRDWVDSLRDKSAIPLLMVAIR